MCLKLRKYHIEDRCKLVYWTSVFTAFIEWTGKQCWIMINIKMGGSVKYDILILLLIFCSHELYGSV